MCVCGCGWVGGGSKEGCVCMYAGDCVCVCEGVAKPIDSGKEKYRSLRFSLDSRPH